MAETVDLQRIEAVLHKHLAQPDLLQEKALLGFAFARKHLTNGWVSRPGSRRSHTDDSAVCSRKISDMMRLVDRHREGARGYDCMWSARTNSDRIPSLIPIAQCPTDSPCGAEPTGVTMIRIARTFLGCEVIAILPLMCLSLRRPWCQGLRGLEE